MDGIKRPELRRDMMHADQQRDQFALVVREEGVDLSDVWLRYFANAGSAEESQFRAYAEGTAELSQLERDLVSLALREIVEERLEALWLLGPASRP